MSVRKVLVAGAGQMGAGIAQVAAQAGLDVVMTDVADEFIVRGMAIIEKGLGKQVEKGKLQAAERDAALGRIVTGTDLSLGKGADLFIEAVPETLELKKDVLGRADAVLGPQAILATPKCASSSKIPAT